MRHTPVLAIVVLLGLVPATATAQKLETYKGYAEWRHGNVLVVDGQRIRVNGSTAFKGAARDGLAFIDLGWEVTAKGARLDDGSVLAREIEAKPNGTGAFEKTIASECDDQEQQWLRDGAVTEEDENGRSTLIGDIQDSGPDVERVQRILTRITPPYVDQTRFRVYVVDSNEWNAMAMANGSIWVFRGLLHDMNDDEVALVVGHELAHVTHEHLRREFNKGLWVQGLTLAGVFAAEMIDNDWARLGTQYGAMLAGGAFVNHFSRDSEAQADRVGLRYAYEGGYDPGKAPQLWERFRDKYGDNGKLMTFFFGSHPRESDRIAKMQEQVALNYTAGPHPIGAASTTR